MSVFKLIYKRVNVNDWVKMLLTDIMRKIVDPFKHLFQVSNIKYDYSVAKKGINSVLI